jgi:hypothetical protein
MQSPGQSLCVVVAALSDLALSALGLWAPVARADPAGQVALADRAGLVAQADRVAQADQGAWAVQLDRAQVVLAVQVVRDARVRVVDELREDSRPSAANMPGGRAGSAHEAFVAGCTRPAGPA